MVNRRGFLKALAATAIAVPLAPLIPKAKYATGGVLRPPKVEWFYGISPVRKISAVIPVTQELLEDAPFMRSYVEARLRAFLAFAEDEAMLFGRA